MSLRSYLDGDMFAERTDGDAPPIVALHGWGRDRNDMTALVAGHAALVPDLPGFGSSPPPPEAWGAADYSLAVSTMLESDARGPYIAVGHSRGGCIAAVLAATRPELVSGAVFFGAPLLHATPATRPPLAYRTARMLHRWHVLPETTMERFRQRYGSADYKAARGVMRAVLVRVLPEDYGDYLARIDAPVAFCWGERDTAVPVEVAQRAAALAPNVVDVDIVAGAGHDVLLEAPDRARAAIEKVIAAAGRT